VLNNYQHFNKGVAMKRAIVYLAVISLGLLLKSCNTTEPPPPPDGEKPTLELKLEDVSCIEAWLKLTTTNLQLPATITLKQFNPTGDTTYQILNLNTQDSLLYIDSLLPNKSYQYQISSIEHQVSSNELSVTTMDTTSHNFTFESWTFGTIGSSTLHDVAIINENNIWAVGEILVADTSQNGYTTYNAMHWDGNQWELKRIPYYDYGGYLVYGSLQTVFAFSENDVWFCSYANLLQYNGSDYLSRAFFMTSINFNGQVTKMWGTDGSNIYCVGRNGAIYHYYGTGWTPIESETDLNINDICGDYNEKTDEWEILAVCGNILQGLESERVILKIIDGDQVQQINAEGANWPLRTVWFLTSQKYYVAGSGIYEKHYISQSIWENDVYDITTYSVNKLRGTSINDVVATGGLGEFLHFNGLTWKSYINETGWFSGSYGGIAVINNLVVTVGYEGAQSKIMMGYR
jgi:hypothetical protein